MYIPERKQRQKVSNLRSADKKDYIVYFQSVITVGIVTKARNQEDAEEKAKNKLKDGGFAGGIFSQTPLSISETEPWINGQNCFAQDDGD